MKALSIGIAGAVLAASIVGAQRGQVRREPGIEEGQAAADFNLKLLTSEKTFKLSDNFGKRPTVLIFGSYT